MLSVDLSLYFIVLLAPFIKLIGVPAAHSLFASFNVTPEGAAYFFALSLTSFNVSLSSSVVPESLT